MKTAIAIARESSDNKTLENQYKKITNVAKEMGYRIVEYIGENVSGDVTRDGTGDDSEFIDKLRKCIHISKPDAIFAWYIDRITRTTFKQGAYLDEFSVTPKIPLYFVRDKKWTINPENGDIDFDYINKVAADTTPWEEKESIIARTRPRREEVGSEGFFIGHISDGYCVKSEYGKYDDGRRRVLKTIIIDENRADIIRDIFNMYLNGTSTNQIAAVLNAKGVPTTNNYRASNPDLFGYKDTYRPRGSKTSIERKSAKWDGSAIANILKNEWYNGKRKYRGAELYHEGIVTKEIWDKVKSIRTNKTISLNRKARKNLFLLSGLFYCGKCGAKMYGHVTGLYNHYYCSSYEGGNKCGLRGANKENIEACIYQLISTRAFNDAFTDEGTIFTDFFQMDETTIKRIKSDIETDELLISTIKQEITDSQSAIKTYMRQQGKYSNDTEMVDSYDSLILEERKKINILEAQIINASARIRKNNNRLRSEQGIKPLLRSIQEKRDLRIIQDLFNAVIDRVYIYNADVNCTIIRVIYLNGKYDEFIYAPRLMRTGFLLLSNERMNILHYEERTNLIHSDYYPLSISVGGSITWDDNRTPSKEEVTRIQEARKLLKEDITYPLEEIPSDITLEEYQAMQFPYQFNEDFTVDSFVRITRNTSKVQQYERLEELSDKALEQQKHYREWRKKYNTGKPTQEPWVLRDANYEKICQERKKLYNRRYKIKNNKSLSREAKEKQLEEVQQKLDILSAQVQYLDK